jgi:hypothetical protein
MVILGSLLLASACAEQTPNGTETIVIETTPKNGALCVAQNGRGSWTMPATPGVLVVTRSATPLAISCRTADDWLGGVTVPSSQSVMSYASTLSRTGSAAESDYDYPQHLSISLLEVDSESLRPMFGAEGGRHIPKPQDPAADRARQQDDNVASRFQALHLLLDEGLITAEEYNIRRGANLGALLRYTMTPGGRDLERPPPPPLQVLARMRYLAVAYAEHSISASEQAAERASILEGLLPARPARRGDPPPPIRSQLQLAAELGRTERLRVSNVISEKEAAGEKAKVYDLLNADIAAADAATLAAAGVGLKSSGAPGTLLSGVGILLSTHASESQAKRSWASLQKIYPEELGKLTLQVKTIPRPHRPSQFRIIAGPLPDAATAKDVCRILKRRDLACQPAGFGE